MRGAGLGIGCSGFAGNADGAIAALFGVSSFLGGVQLLCRTGAAIRSPGWV